MKKSTKHNKTHTAATARISPQPSQSAAPAPSSATASSPGLRIAHRRAAPSRLAIRLLPGQLGDRVVHILQLGHVLQRGQDDGDERPGRISSGVVLRGFRHHGDLQQQGQWKARGDEGWCLNGEERGVDRLIDLRHELYMKSFKSGIRSDA